MKFAIFAGLFLLSLTAEIRADLSDQPKKIQSLVKKLFNLTPDPAIAHRLSKPFELESREEPVNVKSKEILEANNEYAYYGFTNVIISRNGAKMQKNYYSQLICDFHQQLTISQSIDPPDLEIKGDYNAGRNPQNQQSQSFLVKQFDGRITFKTTFNETDDIDIVYNNQEVKFGESSNSHISVIRAIGLVADQINNRTAMDAKNKSSLPKKIKDFESVFPFLSESLSPMNKTAIRSEAVNLYSINNTISEQWSNMNWTLSYVVIRGLNNFKQVKITATDEPTGGVGVRFIMILITNKLGGHFEWRYSNNGHLIVSNRTEEYTIDNLTLTANTRFEKNWIIDKVNIDLGRLHITKSKEDELCPDINVFAYDIFHENLQTLIKRHMKELIHAEYSQPMKATFNTTVTHAAVTVKNQTTVNISNQRSTVNLLNYTTETPKNSTPCVDDRRWWQKFYKRNKCKGIKKSVRTNTSTLQTSKTDECVDTRWWFQKPFIRNKCKPQDKIESNVA